MSKGSLMAVLAGAVVLLAVAVAWMWNDRRRADITIDMPEMHIRK
jgi:hypothetical protein